MIIESFEHWMPESTDKVTTESWIRTIANPAMEKAGYTMVRWCWVDKPDGSPILLSFGEHESQESLKQVWGRKEMQAAREQFYALFPEAKVSRRTMQVIEG